MLDIPAFRRSQALTLILLASSSGAVGAAEDAPMLNSGDTAFVVTCSLMVLLMTLPGLALFYGGLARSKNVLSVLMQVLAENRCDIPSANWCTNFHRAVT